MTIKGDVNKKWTSSTAYRSNHDRIFGNAFPRTGCDNMLCVDCDLYDQCIIENTPTPIGENNDE